VTASPLGGTPATYSVNLFWIAMDPKGSFTVTGSSGSCVIAKFKDDTSYTVQVSATNASRTFAIFTAEN